MIQYWIFLLMAHCGEGFTFLDERGGEKNKVRKAKDLLFIVVLILLHNKWQLVEVAGKWHIAL